MDEKNLRDMWGAVAMRGLAAMLFGVAAVFWPGLTIVTLVYLFGTYVLVSGLINLVVGLTDITRSSGTSGMRVLLLVLGIAEIGVGIYLLRHPQVTFATFILLISAVLIVRGLFDLFTGIFGEGAAGHRTITIISGLVAGLAGIVLLSEPAKTSVAFVWILGLYALITGPLLIALASEGKRALDNGGARAAR